MSLIVLDRDGVINQDSDDYIKSVEEWEPIPGSLEAISQLSHAGFTVAIATNQSGLARGLFDIDDLNAIHQTLRRRLLALGGRIEMIAFCPHGPDDRCRCRKPRPGLLQEIRRCTHLSLRNAPVIGDSVRDLEAAGAVGARPILVRTGKGLATERALATIGWPLPVFDDLHAAAAFLLAQHSQQSGASSSAFI
jgi:D-glycero-D-manno-heptose 1,7-bisphosphate phosphatase